MLRRFFTALAATLAFSGTSTAQEAVDWTGVYGGLSYMTGYQPENTALLPGLAVDLGTTAVSDGIGFFGGYLHQFGQYVVGAEVHATSYSAAPANIFADRLGDMVDLRLRAGYAHDRFLFSGFVGLSEQAYVRNATTPPSETISMSGFTYGLGVDYALPNNLLIGVEYAVRDVQGLSLSTGPIDFRSQDETFRIRFGIRF